MWLRRDLIVLRALVNCARPCSAVGAELERENLTSNMRSRIPALGIEERLCVREAVSL
jgi:hypothetical protein